MSDLSEKISGFEKLTPQKQRLIEMLFRMLLVCGRTIIHCFVLKVIYFLYKKCCDLP